MNTHIQLAIITEWSRQQRNQDIISRCRCVGDLEQLFLFVRSNGWDTLEFLDQERRRERATGCSHTETLVERFNRRIGYRLL